MIAETFSSQETKIQLTKVGIKSEYAEKKCLS